MKNWKIALGLIILVIMISACVKKESSSGSAAENIKKLIVYYSLTGNTEFVAKHIQSLTGADILELELTEPYPVEFEAVITRLNNEREAGTFPELRSSVDNLTNYDVIFLGTPNWFGTLASPLLVFLASHDLSGKTIVPFVTFGRGGFQNTITDLKTALPESTILEEFGVMGNEAENSQEDILQWLSRIEMLKNN